MTKQQSARAWVAIDPDGLIVFSAATRHAVEERLFWDRDGFHDWQTLRRLGWRIKRARVAVEG